MTYTNQVPLTDVKLTMISFQGFWHTECQEIKRTGKAVQLKDSKGRTVWFPVSAIQVSEDNQQCGEIKGWFNPDSYQERWLGVA